MDKCPRCKNFEDIISFYKDGLKVLEQQVDYDFNLISYLTFKGLSREIINEKRSQLEEKRNKLSRGYVTIAGMYNDYAKHLIDHED